MFIREQCVYLGVIVRIEHWTTDNEQQRVSRYNEQHGNRFDTIDSTQAQIIFAAFNQFSRVFYFIHTNELHTSISMEDSSIKFQFNAKTVHRIRTSSLDVSH